MCDINYNNSNMNKVKAFGVPTHGSGWLEWCDFEPTKNKYRGDYPVNSGPNPPLVLLKSNMQEMEWMPGDDNKELPVVPPNGGLYGGPQSTKPWANIPLPADGSYLINKNLPKNTAPGANVQYVGGNRLGNNYQRMDGVYWFNPNDKNGKYMIKGT